jgi:hypothetical protein
LLDKKRVVETVFEKSKFPKQVPEKSRNSNSGLFHSPTTGSILSLFEVYYFAFLVERKVKGMLQGNTI